MKRFFQGNSFQKFLFHDVMVVKLRVLEHRVAVWRRFGRSYYRTRQTSYRVVTELLPSCYRVVAVRPLVDSFDCYGRNKSIGWPVCVCVCVCCRVCWPFGLLPFVFFFVSCVCVCVCVCCVLFLGRRALPISSRRNAVKAGRRRSGRPRPVALSPLRASIRNESIYYAPPGSKANLPNQPNLSTHTHTHTLKRTRGKERGTGKRRLENETRK